MNEGVAEGAAVVTGAVGGVALAKFIAAFVLVICLMLAIAWLVKRAGLAGPVLRRHSLRRLSVVEFTPVDHRRKLVLVRRDGREHLLLLGPDHSIVVETNIDSSPPALESVAAVSAKEPARAPL